MIELLFNPQDRVQGTTETLVTEQQKDLVIKDDYATPMGTVGVGTWVK